MIYNILQDLADNPSRLAKEQILRDNIDNELLKQVFDAALNPYRVFGIKKIPKYEVDAAQKLDLETSLNQLGRFESREFTGNTAIAYLAKLLKESEPGDAIVLQRIIKKDLRCGVQASTVNKIWPGLIPTFPCLLGKVYDEKTAENISWPAIAQLKADGMRAMAWLEDGVVQIRGRSGKPIEFNGIVEERLRPVLEATTGGVLDGELVVLEDNGTIMSRKKGNGLLNKAIKGTVTDDISDRVRFRVWDMIGYPQFLAGQDLIPYSVRLSDLTDVLREAYGDGLMSQLKDQNNYCELIEGRVVANIDEAREYFAEALARGEEGIMLKDMESPWEDKRSKYVLKFKSELDCDLEVIGWNQGTAGTKNAEKVGSLVCASEDRMVEVSISGFSDELRDEITNNINDWIGKIVTVKYNERIASKESKRQGVDSLFLPRFLEERLDKSIADHSSKIK